MSKLTMLEEGSAPATPSSGKWVAYFKSTGLYIKDDAGNEIGPLIKDAPSDGTQYARKNAAWDAVAASGGGDFLSTLTNAEVSITGATTATISKMHVCSGSSNYTVSLPAASGNTGKLLGFRFTNTGVTTLDGNSAETIDGVATRTYFQNQTVVLLCDGSNWFTVSGVTAPRSIEVYSDVIIRGSGVMTKSVEAGQLFATSAYNGTPVNGDTFSIGIWLTAGTYTCIVLGLTDNTTAKLDWTLDGVSQTTAQDWYSATRVQNVEKTFTLTVPYTGYHILKATVNGKNASSSNYYVQFTKFTIVPSAY